MITDRQAIKLAHIVPTEQNYLLAVSYKRHGKALIYSETTIKQAANPRKRRLMSERLQLNTILLLIFHLDELFVYSFSSQKFPRS